MKIGLGRPRSVKRKECPTTSNRDLEKMVAKGEFRSDDIVLMFFPFAFRRCLRAPESTLLRCVISWGGANFATPIAFGPSLARQARSLPFWSETPQRTRLAGLVAPTPGSFVC